MMKKTKRKPSELGTEVHQPSAHSECALSKDCCQKLHYENLQFAQSLEHYENVKDLKVRLEPEPCTKCECAQRKSAEGRGGEEDYLLMGPVPSGVEGAAVTREKSSPPPYLPMNAIRNLCPCTKPAFTEPLNDGSRSATASPFLRRHDPTSCYLTEERRRIAQIRYLLIHTGINQFII